MADLERMDDAAFSVATGTSASVGDGVVDIDSGGLFWTPSDPKKMDRLVEYGVFENTEHMALSAQVINELGKFRFHVLNDQLRLAHREDGKNDGVHRLDPADMADLRVCERQIEVIKALQPIEQLLNVNATKADLMKAVASVRAALVELKANRDDPKKYEALRKLFPLADTYMQEQEAYLERRLQEIEHKVLDDDSIKDFSLQEWFRRRLNHFNYQMGSVVETLNLEKFRVKNFGGLRTGKLHASVLDLDKLISEHQFDQKTSDSQINADSQCQFSQSGATTFASVFFDKINSHNLSKAIVGIELGVLDHTPEENQASGLAQRAMTSRRELKATLRADDEKRAPSAGETVKNGLSGLGRAVRDQVLNFPGAVVSEVGSGIKDYVGVDSSTGDTEGSDNIADQVFEHFMNRQADFSAHEDANQPLLQDKPEAMPAGSEPPVLSPEEDKVLAAITNLITKAAKQEPIEQSDLDELQGLSDPLSTSLPDEIGNQPSKKNEPSSAEAPVFAQPGKKLFVVGEGDLVTSAFKACYSGLRVIEHDLYRKKPLISLGATACYLISAGVFIAPHAAALLLAKLGVSQKGISGFFHAMHSLTQTIGGGDGAMSQGITAGFTMAKLGFLPTDLLSNGSTSFLLKGMIERVQAARMRGEFKDAASAMKYVSQEFMQAAVGLSFMMAAGYGLCHVPGLSSEVGQDWEFAALILSAKVIGLGHDMVKAVHSMPTDLLDSKTLSSADRKLIILAKIFEVGMQSDPKFMDKHFKDPKLKKQFCQALLKLDSKVDLSQKINMQLFGKSQRNFLTRVLIGIVKPVALIAAVCVSPLVGAIKAIRAPKGEKMAAFRQVVSRSLTRLSAWAFELGSLTGLSIGTILKTPARPFITAAKRAPGMVMRSAARIAAANERRQGREAEAEATENRARSRVYRWYQRVDKRMHRMDRVPRFFKNLVRAGRALFQRMQRNNMSFLQTVRSLFGGKKATKPAVTKVEEQTQATAQESAKLDGYSHQVTSNSQITAAPASQHDIRQSAQSVVTGEFRHTAVSHAHTTLHPNGHGHADTAEFRERLHDGQARAQQNNPRLSTDATPPVPKV